MFKSVINAVPKACLYEDPFHKPHNSLDKYPTMHMWTPVHISGTKQCIVGYGAGALWDLYNKSVYWSSAYPAFWF